MESTYGLPLTSDERKMLLDWKRVGIMTFAGYILGFPNDTPESIDGTSRRAEWQEKLSWRHVAVVVGVLRAGTEGAWLGAAGWVGCAHPTTIAANTVPTASGADRCTICSQCVAAHRLNRVFRPEW